MKRVYELRVTWDEFYAVMRAWNDGVQWGMSAADSNDLLMQCLDTLINPSVDWLPFEKENAVLFKGLPDTLLEQMGVGVEIRAVIVEPDSLIRTGEVVRLRAVSGT